MDIQNKIKIRPLLKHSESYFLHLSSGFQAVHEKVPLFQLLIAIQRV
jgi:hypothetical protein